MTPKPTRSKSFQLADPLKPSLTFAVNSLSKPLDVIAILDTGFEGEIALPKSFLQYSYRRSLKWSKIMSATGLEVLATTKEKISFLDQVFSVEIIWLEVEDDPLIGSGFFAKNLDKLSLEYSKERILARLK